MTRLFRWALRVVPNDWRDAVARDLLEETDGRTTTRADLWRAAQAIRIAIGLRFDRRRRFVQRVTPRAWTFSGLGADIRDAVRTGRRQLASTIAIVATLAVGIGATTAIYCVFDALLFRPTPGAADPSTLISVEFGAPGVRAYGTRRAFPSLRAAGEPLGLQFLGDAVDVGSVAMRAPVTGDSELATCAFVSSQYFTALGLRPIAGRLLTDAEADAGADLAVISESLWNAHFGRRDDVVGQTIVVNGHTLNVVGVIGGFDGSMLPGNNAPVDVWAPMGRQDLLMASMSDRDIVGDLTGRVRAGTSLPQLQDALQAAYRNFGRTLPPRDAAFMPYVHQSSELLLSRSRSAIGVYRLMMGGVLILLLLSCANAANLLLARTLAGRRDVAVRLALGASRWRIARRHLVQSAAIVAVSTASGVGLAMLLTAAVRGLRVVSYLPEIRVLTVNGRVLLSCTCVAAAVVVLFGVLPAIVAARTNVHGVLARVSRAVSAPHRIRESLVIGQIALALLLVAGAGVLNRSLQKELSADLGLDLDHVLQLTLRPDDLGYSSGRSAKVVQDTVQALQQEGLSSVASSYPVPLWGSGADLRIQTRSMSQPEKHTLATSSVSPDFFRVLGIPIVAGRALSASEFGESPSIDPMPVVVSESFVRAFLQGAPPVGQQFFIERSRGMAMMPSTALVVGVAADVRASARGRILPTVYHSRIPDVRYGAILIRPDRMNAALLSEIRGAVQRVDPALPITALTTLRSTELDDLAQDRVLARLSALLALCALLLAMSGVAAVVAQVVAERTRDFGIRSALGASARDLGRLVLTGVGVRLLAGVIVGAAIYAYASRWLVHRIYGVTALDTTSMVLTLMALTAAGLAASWLPARRAARIDPVVALRAE